MDILERVPSRFKKPAIINDLTVDNQYLRSRHTIPISEATQRLAPILLKMEQIAKRKKELRQRLTGLNLRIEVIQDEIKRLKKKVEDLVD